MPEEHDLNQNGDGDGDGDGDETAADCICLAREVIEDDIFFTTLRGGLSGCTLASRDSLLQPEDKILFFPCCW